MRENWITCTLGELLTLKNGFAFKSSNYINEGIPVIRIGDINNWIVDENQAKCVVENKEYDGYIVEKGDILIAMSGATTGKFGVYESDSKAYQNQRVGNLKPSSKDLIDKKYIFNLLYSLKYQIEKDAYGGAQPNISAGKIHALNTVLAPLPEQRAIVAKIEELFSDLDKGIADLNLAKDQLKVYRQAVLKKAFEGEYPQKKIIEIADVNTGATPKRGNSEFWENGTIPWVTSTVVNNDFVNEPSELITENAIKQTNCKLIPKGSLLVAMYGEGKTRGKCSELNIDTATNQALAGITLFKEYKESKQFVKWFFVKNYEEIRLLSSGGVQPNLNLTIIKNTIIPFPEHKQQIQIAKEIESRLSICDKVEENITESLEKAKALRQSILKKAFEGTLLSEEEIATCKAAKDYEPASVLLKKIKAEKKK
jgi:type I restriction enzyme, S subunit